jgi:hypothetical protein
MISFLWDNDVLFKITDLNLWTELESILTIDKSNHFYLNTCIHVARKKAFPSDQTKVVKLESILKKMSIVKAAKNIELLSLLSDQVGIDAGEALLYTKLYDIDPSFLYTGDKRSLLALQALSDKKIDLTFLNHRVILWEYILELIIQRLSIESIQEKFSNQTWTDNAFKVIFSKHNLTNKESLLESIQSYIREAETKYGRFLVSKAQILGLQS